MIRSSLLLGLRFARSRSYVSRVRGITVLLTALVLVFAALCAFAGYSVVQEQQRIEDSRTPLDAEGGQSVPGFAEFTNKWDGLEVTRVVIVDGDRYPMPHPPGLERNPGPGEAVVSPAAKSALATSPTLRLALTNQRIVGTIGSAGLRSPQEVRIIQGRSVHQARNAVLEGVKSFGYPANPVVDFKGPLAFLLPVAVTLVLLPLLIALALAARLSSDITDKRFRLLRALGVSSPACRVIAMVELTPHCVGGSFLGWLAFVVTRQRLDWVPGTEFRFWPAQTQLDGSIQLLVPTLCCLFCLAVAGLSVSVPIVMSTRPAQTSNVVKWRWIAPSILGALIVVSAAALPWESRFAKVVAVIGAGLILLGMPFLFRVVIQRASTLFARRATRGGSLLGARWVGQDAGAAFRLATSISMGLLIVGLTLPMVAMLKGDPVDGKRGLAAAKGYNALLVNTGLNPNQVRALSTVRQALVRTEAADPAGEPVEVLFASCKELTAIVRATGCDGGPQWISGIDSPVKGFISSFKPPIVIGGNSHLLAHLPESEVRTSLGAQFHGNILLDSRYMQSVVPNQGQEYLLNLSGGVRSLKTFEGEMASADPTASQINDFSDWIDIANAYLSYIRLVQIALGVGLIGATLALVAASMRNAVERRRTSAVLMIVGAPRRDRIRAHVISQFTPVFTCSIVAVAFSSLFWLCMQLIDPRSAVSTGGYITLLAAPFVIALIATVTTLPSALNNSGPDDWRSSNE